MTELISEKKKKKKKEERNCEEKETETFIS